MKPIISPNVRIRYPELFKIGNYSIVDDFCYFLTKVTIVISSHIAGGRNLQFICGDFGSLSAGVRVFCASDDFVNDLAGIFSTGFEYLKNNLIKGDVTLRNYVSVRSNSIVIPGACNRCFELCQT